MVLSPAEAARRLNISERRVRALLREGRIPAQQVAGRWIIDEADAARYRPGAVAGRPLSERSAWQLIRYARNTASHGTPISALTPVERHRLNKRLRRLRESSEPLKVVSSLLAKRAEKVGLSSSPADLAELRQDPRIRLSGVSHPDSGLLSGAEVEAYVSRRHYEVLVRDWFLVKTRPGQLPNVVLHVAEDIPEELPVLVIAADLAERPGAREQEAALELIRTLRED